MGLGDIYTTFYPGNGCTHVMAVLWICLAVIIIQVPLTYMHKYILYKTGSSLKISSVFSCQGIM